MGGAQFGKPSYDGLLSYRIDSFDESVRLETDDFPCWTGNLRHNSHHVQKVAKTELCNSSMSEASHKTNESPLSFEYVFQMDPHEISQAVYSGCHRKSDL